MISIIVATFGDFEYWNKIADRAMRSATQQTEECEVIRVHGDTLAQARNLGAEQASCRRIVFLDADDELEPQFAAKVVEPEDVLQPKAVIIGEGGDAQWIEPRQNFLDGNHIVVGAPVSRDVFLEVGGFDEWPIAEDWALWLKIKKAGGSFGRTQATYLIHQNPQGRNSQDDQGVYEMIRSAYR